MGESKSNQRLDYGQSVVEPEFRSADGDYRTVQYAPSPVFDETPEWYGYAECEFGCDRGWLPAPDGYSYRCVCNVELPAAA